MDSVNKRVILISVILALFTSFLIFAYIKKETIKPETAEYINVYVAAKTMPAKHLITEKDIVQEKVTRNYLNENAVLNKADIIGKRIRDRIIEGEQVLRDRLIDSGSMTLSYNIPKGMRAVSINVNEQVSVANMLRPGDFVDVVASFEKQDVQVGTVKFTNPRVSKLIIQNIQVLALDQEQSVSDEKLKEPVKTVTVAVLPEDSERLVYASDFGSIRLALRPVDDNAIKNSSGITREELIPGKELKK